MPRSFSDLRSTLLRVLVSADSVVTTNPEDVMKRWGAAWNRHHLDAVVVMLDPNFVEYTPAAPEPVKGRDAYRKVQEPHFKAFPDLELKILSIAASSDLVAAELSFAGTFKGPSNARAMALSAVLLEHNTI